MSRYPADLSSHSTQQVSGLDKCIFQNIDVTFPIQPSIHLGEKANTFFINASPHHDTTTSLFHCWLVTLLVGWLHSSITPIQKKLAGFITKNYLGPMFNCPILVGSCKLQAGLLVTLNSLPQTMPASFPYLQG